MNTAGYVDELSVDRVAPAGARGYAELGITPTSVTEGLAVEMIRRVCCAPRAVSRRFTPPLASAGPAPPRLLPRALLPRTALTTPIAPPAYHPLPPPRSFHRVGGYRHGDMKSVSKAVPDHIKKFFGLDTIASQR